METRHVRDDREKKRYYNKENVKMFGYLRLVVYTRDRLLV